MVDGNKALAMAKVEALAYLTKRQALLGRILPEKEAENLTDAYITAYLRGMAQAYADISKGLKP